MQALADANEIYITETIASSCGARDGLLGQGFCLDERTVSLKGVGGVDGAGLEAEGFALAQDLFAAADHGAENGELRNDRDGKQCEGNGFHAGSPFSFLRRAMTRFTVRKTTPSAMNTTPRSQ